ncbi:MAG: hypothetical protein OXG88_09950, partial [Gammaproteobacteria bacterium]|nr:hypothetical protein [Gammaproteobacteria bacterium]
MDSWPNQEALNKALNIYRVSMRSFIIFHLKKIPGMNIEDVVIDSVGDWRADEIDRILSESDRDIGSVIDINDFPHLVNKNWGDAFEKTLNDDKTFRNQLWLIVECRNADWAHPPEGDAEFESTRAHLFLIADVLGKINKSDAKDRVEVIRDELDDTAERLADAEEWLRKMEAKNAEHKKSLAEAEKHLETAKLEKSKYDEDNATLSKQVDEKEKLRKKLSKQLKSARAETDKYKKNLSNTKKRLEKSEAAHTGYKERLETKSNELKDIKDELAAIEMEKTADKKHLKTISKELEEAKAKWDASEARFATISNELVSVQAEKEDSEKYLAATQNLLTTVAIGDQTVFPPLGTDAAVRIIDRRGTDKRNYLMHLLEQKQPTIIYVQSEEKIDELLTFVGQEKAQVIGRHDERTSEVKETEMLKKLENGELIAIVSNITFSTLVSSHRIEHFVFCHLTPGLDEFFKRCQPAFTLEKNTYLHLIYNDEQDVKNLDEWLAQKYPDREVLKNLYRALEGFIGVNRHFVKPENLYSKLDIERLEITELGIETGLAIFEEVGALERNNDGIKLLPFSGRKSKIHRKGEALKDEIEEIRSFQLEQSVEKIWEEILGALDIDLEKYLLKSNVASGEAEVAAEIVLEEEETSSYEASSRSMLSFWIESFEFDACVFGCKSPIDAV